MNATRYGRSYLLTHEYERLPIDTLRRLCQKRNIAHNESTLKNKLAKKLNDWDETFNGEGSSIKDFIIGDISQYSNAWFAAFELAFDDMDKRLLRVACKESNLSQNGDINDLKERLGEYFTNIRYRELEAKKIQRLMDTVLELAVFEYCMLSKETLVRLGAPMDKKLEMAISLFTGDKIGMEVLSKRLRKVEQKKYFP